MKQHQQDICKKYFDSRTEIRQLTVHHLCAAAAAADAAKAAKSDPAGASTGPEIALIDSPTRSTDPLLRRRRSAETLPLFPVPLADQTRSFLGVSLARQRGR